MLSEKSFQKPEQCLRSNESDSNLHNNNNSCKNHPLKKAKYTLDSNNKLNLCTKCALEMSIKGNVIIEKGNDEERYKSQKLKNFIINLQNQQKLAWDLQKELYKKSNFFSQINSEQQITIQHLFALVLTVLQHNRTELEQRLSENLKSIKLKIEKNLSILEESEKNIQKIYVDIEKNHSKILKNMEIRAFDEVLLNYEKRINEISKSSNLIRSEFFEYFIIEENLTQIQNFKKNDMNKFFTTFSKTVFLNNYPEQKEIKKETKSHNKTHSVHYKISEKFLEGKKDSFFSNCKENSFNNSNFQSKRENRNI